jgi:hypothetical protein
MSVLEDANPLRPCPQSGRDTFSQWGEAGWGSVTRFTTGTMYTDKLFTGQREMAGLGIYHYGARFRKAPPKRSGVGVSPYISAGRRPPDSAEVALEIM